MREGVFSRDERGKMRMVSKFPVGDGIHELRVETWKHYYGGVVCSANGVTPHADGLGWSVKIPGDYSAVLARAPKVRATEKAIRAIHAEGLAKVNEALAAARAMYGVKEAA